MKTDLAETVDLRQWLSRCQAAGVPTVPAEICPISIPIEILLPYSIKLEKNLTIAAISSWTEETTRRVAAHEGRAMWRWSHCAPIEIKAAIANPGIPVRMPWPLEAIDDERLLAILTECQQASATTVTTIVRPWVNAAIEADYPVEFRVFVNKNGDTSTSSYYTQRALNMKWIPQAKEAVRLATSLRPHVAAGIEFSADFLVTTSGETLFLEGGPSPENGADPCCFKFDHPFGDGKIVLW